MSLPSGPSSSRAIATVSATLVGCGVIASAPACSRLMSSRLSTSRVSRSSDSSTLASSSPWSSGLNRTPGARSPPTAAFAEARGVRRS